MPVWMVFFGWLAAGLFLSPWDVRAQTGPYDSPSGIQSPGRVVTDYIQASLQRRFRIQVASEALERCGQSPFEQVFRRTTTAFWRRTVRFELGGTGHAEPPPAL